MHWLQLFADYILIPLQMLYQTWVDHYDFR